MPLRILLAAVAMLGPAFVARAETQPSVTAGAQVYRQFCRQCHGPDMVNPGTVSFDLRRFPPDQNERFVNSVVHGKGNMPAWGDTLQPDEIAAVWDYVRTGGGQRP